MGRERRARGGAEREEGGALGRRGEGGRVGRGG